MDVTDFLSLAAAEHLDVRLGELRLRFPDTERAALQHFAGKIPHEVPGVPAAAAQ
jgi:hypothetical protein